jgi:hypothetical protein
MKNIHVLPTDKPTAVDYLFNELIANPGNFIKAYKQAKEMEKEQTLEFTRNAVRKILDEDRQNSFNLEQYYKETYKKDK